VTDVTGYGLLGHAVEIAERSGVKIRINSARVPLLSGAVDVARHGVRTSADSDHRRSLTGRIQLDKRITDDRIALLVDPQTSGGLLASVSSDDQKKLEKAGFCQIGNIELSDAMVVVE